MSKAFLSIVAATLLALSTGSTWAADAPVDNGPLFPLIEAEPSCPRKIFTDALAARAGDISPDADTYSVEAWIYNVFQDPNTITRVLNCPDVALAPKDAPIIVPTVEFRFTADDTDARTIMINYATTREILNQRLLVANKPKNPGSASERISFGSDADTVWVNTDPAWYAIMIVAAGALDNYVGRDKNNTISLKYMLDNRGTFFPGGGNLAKAVSAVPMCTSGSAFANDNDIINIAAHRTAGEKSEWFRGNDYYVAGDVNLQWVTWAEVAGDIALTVATLGGGAALSVGAKVVRGGRTIKNLNNEIRALKALDTVADYRRAAIALNRNGPALQRTIDATRAAIRTEGDALRIAREIRPLSGDAANTARLATLYGKTPVEINALKRADLPGMEKRIADLGVAVSRYQDELARLTDNVSELSGGVEVKKYLTAIDDLKSVNALVRDLKAWKIPQRGNIIARAAKTMIAEARTNRILKTAGRGTGKAGGVAGRIRDGLFTTTRRFQSGVGRAVAPVGPGMMALDFVKEMYDWTDTSTNDYTSGLEFKPFCLLSADDLDGAENVVNRGMWIMWGGDSVAPADDDAAYLQAMDFAQKLYEDITDVQDDVAGMRLPNQLCDVDIYVVRPIVRNPETDKELYYLIMNDQPWEIRR